MAAHDVITPYIELDELLVELLGHWRRILGGNLAGAYVQGSFALALATWVDIDTIAWGQRYAVVTACRILYTLHTAEVTSKPGALKWALRTLEPRWRPLLAQVRDECGLGWDPDRPPRAGEADAARAFVVYAVVRAHRADALEWYS